MKRKSLLIVCNCLGLLGGTAGCGWTGDPPPGSLQEVRETQQSAEEELKTLGATLVRKEYPITSAWAVDLSGKQVDDRTFELLKQIDGVSELNLSGTAVTDAQMKQFSDTTFGGKLVKVDLTNTQVTDEALKGLENSLFLQELIVPGTRITDAGLREFQTKRTNDSRVMAAFKKIKVVK